MPVSASVPDVNVQVHEGGWLLPLPASALRTALQAMLEAAEEGGRPVELHVLRDGEMAVENAQHMGCPGPTNILSFPACNEGGMTQLAALLPDTLLLSVDTLHRECLLYGQEPAGHTLRLLAHGLGHVLGNDHGPDMDALCARMWVAGGAACGLALTQDDY